MHLIDRVRNQAAATEREDRLPNSAPQKPASRLDLLVQALPTLLAVGLWGVATAALYGGVRGIAAWDLIMVLAIAPIVMLLVGYAWGQQKDSFEAGLDAAIIVGVLAGLLFLLIAIA